MKSSSVSRKLISIYLILLIFTILGTNLVHLDLSKDLDLFMVVLMVGRGHSWSFAVISRLNTAHTFGILSQNFSKFYRFLDYVISIMSRVSLIGH